MKTRLYRMAEKKTIAMIFTLVARLAKVPVKTIDDTVIWIETKDFVETNHPLMKTKFSSPIDTVEATKNIETLGDILGLERTRHFFTR